MTEQHELDDEQLVERYRGWPIDRDTAFRFRGYAQHELRFKRCRSCGTWHEPPGPVCPSCWSRDLEELPVSGKGTIHLAMFMRQGPPVEGVDYSSPYPVITVELDEQPGLRFTSTVLEAAQESIVIGERVVVAWTERGGAAFPAFRLATEAEAAR